MVFVDCITYQVLGSNIDSEVARTGKVLGTLKAWPSVKQAKMRARRLSLGNEVCFTVVGFDLLYSELTAIDQCLIWAPWSHSGIWDCRQGNELKGWGSVERYCCALRKFGRNRE